MWRSLAAAAESGCPEPDLEVPGVEFRRANSSLPAQQPTKGRPIRPAAHPRSALWRLAQAAGAVTLSGRHHRPSVSSPSTSSAALPENPNPPHHHISPLSLSIGTPPRPHHLTAPPQPVASPSRAPCRLAPQVREPAGYPNPSILGSAVEEHWGRERGSHQPS
ncbi:hypothetical protein PVAP13_5NG132362 [Panicum virgatum]|uniref:Uncharacterized protein n=1 Tax=Panicum virgatum TaxID=38727 RepID=A0A8T0RLZ0_PANVG|nr:hypothetical protein PVAP13_5NG132362 [Panicum virgatum]